jgi:hypothetical protein
MPEVIYVYGLVRNDFDASRLPTGIDDSAVVASSIGEFRALLSCLPTPAYDADAVARNAGDVAWISPRALAHDRVLTWAQEHGGVVPFPMFSLFSGEDALQALLMQRSAGLRRTFERVHNADEFGVRAHRRDSAMLEVIDQLDEGIGRLRAEAAAASPGQRYLLDRKIAEQATAAIRGAGQRIARDVFERLRPLAREAEWRPLVPERDRAPQATLVLNGAFLVDRATTTAFRAAVAECMREYEGRGISFEFTGPWPPYNFVADSGAGA